MALSPRRLVIALGLGLSLGWLGGCSGSELPDRPPAQVRVQVEPPALETIPAIADVDGLVLPVDRYRLDPNQRRSFGQAHTRIVNECRARFGFDALPDDPPTTASALDRRYGITDAAEAAAWGYHLTPDQGLSQRSKPNVRPQAEGEAIVMTGRESGRPGGADLPPTSFRGQPLPAGGCVADADRALAVPEGLGAVEQRGAFVNADGFNQAMADQRAVNALAAWADCMKHAGYGYATPTAAVAAFNLSTATPSPAERAVAKADVTCKARANVVGILYTLEVAYQEAIIAQKRSELDEVRATLDGAVAKAQAVLTTSP